MQNSLLKQDSRLQTSDFGPKSSKMLKRTVTLFSILLYFAYYSSAQSTCGTIVTDEQIAFEADIENTITGVQTFYRTFNLTIYVVKNEAGEIGITQADINQVITDVNAAFYKIGVSFRQTSLNEIDNYHFNSIKQEDNEQQLVKQFYSKNTINIYLVDELKNTSNEDLCSYTYYPSAEKDMIFCNKTCFSGNILIEQLGHFFNLYHTYETKFGNEFADGSNCTNTGDKCCDTPADPGLASSTDPNCNYTGSSKDSKGDYYKPSPTNYLSASSEECGCYFSDEQLIRMLNAMVLFKSHLW